MKWFDVLKQIQFDLTSHCNARCGACVRNIFGDKTRSDLPLSHFSIDLWKRIWSEDLRGLCIQEVQLNGNWGDPGMHPLLPEMMDIASQYHPEVTMYMHTNGGTHSEQYWADLADNLRWFSDHQVIFAIDGMHDTHSIYRRHTDLNKIANNIRAFTANKGNAVAMMTLFDHNVHQIQEVQDFADSLGMKQFNTRHSHADEMLIKSSTEEYTISTDTVRDLEEIEVRLSKSNGSHLRDADDWIDIHDKIKEGNTKCPWYNMGRIQIDPWANVWPCCHTSGYYMDNANKNFPVKSLGLHNNLTSQSLKQVLKQHWYSRTLPNNITGPNPYPVCVSVCNV